MSTAMNKVTVTRLKDGTTYTAMIACSAGDLIQYFNATTVLPDWSDVNGHPVLIFHAVSTLGSGETDLANMSLYYDGVQVIAAGTYADTQGRFNLAKGSDGLWRCTILKNLVAAGPVTNATNHTIRMVGETTDGSKIQASVNVSCSPLTDQGKRAVIVAGDANCFTVDQAKNNSCVLKAMLIENGVVSDPQSGYAYQWYRQTSASGWTAITGATSQTLTVSSTDVESMAVYRVRVYNTAQNSTEEYYDVQAVMDVGDPFYLNLDVCEGNGTTSASATFAPSEPGTSFRTFRPSVINRNTGSAYSGSVAFKWTIIRPDGTYVNDSSITAGGQNIPARTTAQATLNFPAQLIDDNNGSALDVICEAEFTV